MNLLDVVVVGAAVAAAVGGYQLGFLKRAASWGGLVLGAYAGILVVPLVIRLAGDLSPSGALLIVAVVVVLGAFMGQAIGLVVGHRVREVVHESAAHHVRTDRVVGAVAGGLSVIIGIWLIAPVMAGLPGWPSRLARSSLVARSVSAVFPAAPDAGGALKTIVAGAAGPDVFADDDDQVEAGPPPAGTGFDAETEEAVRRSTVRVSAEGGDCNRIQEGSGFVIQRDVVVTNAHVVAGERRVLVHRHDGGRVEARVAVFDGQRDLAVLVVPGLGLDPLGRADASVGATGAVFGHPRGQPEVRAAPYRIERRMPATGRDIYGEATIRRSIYVMAARLEPGDSGGPVVDDEGQVVGVAFAIAPDLPSTAYALTGVELDPVMAMFNAAPGAEVSTGPCVG